jgi:hypothetical protein
LIGFIKLLPDETLTQAGLANIVSMIQHRDKAPTNALVAEAVRCCAERGIPYLVYSRFSDGEREAGNLVDFKQNNGFRRVELPRYYVPLTWAGRIGYQLGAHKRLADRIPQSLVLKLRAARNAWYGRRLVPSMEKAAK